MQSQSVNFRNFLLKAVEPHLGQPIFLSGGMDSTSILFACLELGVKPTCITFQIGDRYVPDLQIAKSMADVFGFELHVCNIEQNVETLIADTKQCISWLSKRATPKITKVYVQCLHPFLYMVPKLASLGYSSAMWGMVADSGYGIGRKPITILHTAGASAWTRFREQEYADLEASDYAIMDVAKMAYNFTIHDPYYNADVRKLLLSCTFDQLHKPREKSIAYMAFEEYWRQGKWYRLRENLQVGTGLREWHDTMLASTINTRQSKAIIGIYNDILISS